MKDILFNKQVVPWKLHKELVASGFDIAGVSYDAGTNITTTHLNDTETKDPSNVVNSHTYFVEKNIDWKAELQKKITDIDKITVIGKNLGIIGLTDQEIIDGILD